MYCYVNILTNCLFGHILYILVINNGRFHYQSKNKTFNNHRTNTQTQLCRLWCWRSFLTLSSLTHPTHNIYFQSRLSTQDSTQKKRFVMIVFFGRQSVEDAWCVFFSREEGQYTSVLQPPRSKPTFQIFGITDFESKICTLETN